MKQEINSKCTSLCKFYITDSLKLILELQEFKDLPNEIPLDGLIIDNGKVTIGIWIMPNNNVNGMLEDFIRFLVPKDDKLLPIIHETLDKIETEKLHAYLPIHKSKAIIHTWLSWQEDPGTPMGLSITKKYLNTDEATCIKLINWLKRLFNA